MNNNLLKIIISSVLLVAAMVIEHFLALAEWQLLLIYLVPYIIVAYDVYKEAIEGLLEGELLNEDFLMCIATLGALCIGFLPEAEPEFAEAVFVMLFFQVGELFEDYAEDKSRESISHLMDIRPDIAHLITTDGQNDVKPEEVKIGDIVIVKVGEKIPLDGVVVEGQSALNTVALTGESMPRDVATGDEVLSGCVNMSGVLTIRVTQVFGESTASKILSLVENAGEKKAKSETFIAKFAKIYTPIVVGIAFLLAFLPPLILWFMGEGAYISLLATWLNRALTFLVVSCPCALVISVPLTFFGGIGGASKRGILIKGASYMDSLAKTDIVVFDKTGTLTRGEAQVTAVHPETITATELLHLAAHVERYSTHPIGLSLRAAYENEADDCAVEEVEEVAGQGVRARVNGKTVCVGNLKMMQTLGLTTPDCKHTGTIVHVALDGLYVGHIEVSDTVKPDSAEAIRRLKEIGVSRTVMLTGDRQETAEEVAKEVGIDEYHAALLPQNKVEQLERLLAAKDKNRYLAFVGDGINDAPVLARADIGIAMGALGSDAAIEAADIVLMDDKPSKIALAIKISKRTQAIANQNVWFAIGVKVAVLALASVGLAGMGMAVFADVGVTVLAVLNAMRTLRIKA